MRSSGQWRRWNGVASTTRSTFMSDPKSGNFNWDSIAWSPACGNVTNCGICSAATSAKTWSAVRLRTTNRCRETSAMSRSYSSIFIDLVGSTQLTSTREPHEVAEVLNEFFQIVVAAVDERHGLINKFQGDEAIAVFGAPLRIDDPASAALATARALGAELRRLPVDFGIGVSSGPVFAGNIGAENRYEYTVVGDAVNEAARLADRAKDFEGRVLCSAAAIDRADEVERRCWAVQGSEMLRGRSRLTQISAPTREG